MDVPVDGMIGHSFRQPVTSEEGVSINEVILGDETEMEDMEVDGSACMNLVDAQNVDVQNTSGSFIPDAQTDMKPTIGMNFDTEEDAYNFYNRDARACGFSVRKDQTHKRNPTLAAASVSLRPSLSFLSGLLLILVIRYVDGPGSPLLLPSLATAATSNISAMTVASAMGGAGSDSGARSALQTGQWALAGCEEDGDHGNGFSSDVGKMATMAVV
ncbi:hypothetical protein ACLOJK_027816 [Asimina triloba]